MNCWKQNKDQADLLAFCAGKLDTARSAGVAEHLKTCSACSEFVADQQAVWHALDAWDAPEVSANFNRRLFQRLEQKVSWWDRWLLSLRSALVPVTAAACLIVVAGLVSFHSPAARPAPKPPIAKVENLRPDQVESAVDDLQMLSDFSRATRADADEL